MMGGRHASDRREGGRQQGPGSDSMLQYDSGMLPFDDYAPAPGEDYQFYEDLVCDAKDQYKPEVLVHFTSDENVPGILENGPLSGHAGFGEGLYCVDESSLHLESMPRVFILQQMYCKLAYMDREPCDTGLLSRARHANAYIRLETRKLLEDGRFGVTRIINGQTNKMLTNYLIYKRPRPSASYPEASASMGAVAADKGGSRSLNVKAAGGLKRSLVTPKFFALPSHGWHPDFEPSDAATHVPEILQVNPGDLMLEASSRDWHVSRAGRYQAPSGTALRTLQDHLQHVSVARGTPWQFKPPTGNGVRGHARKEQYLAQERARMKRK